MSKTYLKIKIKNLADEAWDIRHEEKKFKGWKRFCERTNDPKLEEATNTFWGLRNHRKDVVRPEARAALVAYGFIRELPYRVVENPAKDNIPDMQRVYTIAHKYGPYDRFDDVKRLVDKWMDIPVSANQIQHQAEARLAMLAKKKEQRKKKAA